MAALITRLPQKISAALVIAATAFAALLAMSLPGQARVFVGLSFGVPGPWGYYPPPAYYYYPYPVYYGYPYYPYAGGAYAWRPYYHHPYHHRHRHWH